MSELSNIANNLVASGKGILAADESLPTIKKRFDKIGVESTEENRHSWRELLFSAYGVEEYISGVILFEDTLRDESLVKLLTDKNILVGIKVDMGKKSMANSREEMLTQGLNDLKERLPEYKQLGAKFTKWRAVFKIGEGLPSHEAIHENACFLGRFAILCQDAGLVPIVEPEVLMEGDHDINKCSEITAKILTAVFDEIKNYHVDLTGMLLKPNMILPGKNSDEKVSAEEISKITLETMKSVVPEEVPGLVFLSGGQSPEDATENLQAMNNLNNVPWKLSFSFGRALQNEALEIWKGDVANKNEAQEKFITRAKKCLN